MLPRDWFDRQVYGVEPPPPDSVDARPGPAGDTLLLHGPGGTLSVRLRACFPADARPARRVPAIIALNLLGNDETLPGGAHASRWPVGEVVDRGHAVVTAAYGDFAADADGFTGGVHRLLRLPTRPRPADGAGCLGAWAWGLTLIRRHLATDPRVDPARIAVLGHSRLGKAALLAAARDPGLLRSHQQPERLRRRGAAPRKARRADRRRRWPLPLLVCPRLRRLGRPRRAALPRPGRV